MRLIDADQLLQKLQKDPLFPLVEQYGISRVIKAAPTVDAVPVIRCKDCRHKYYDGNQIICQKMYYCDGNNFEPSAEDFCSQG